MTNWALLKEESKLISQNLENVTVIFYHASQHIKFIPNRVEIYMSYEDYEYF